MTAQGFFSRRELKVVKTPEPLLAQCGECGLDKECITPRMVPFGQFKQKIMVLGEASGANEDAKGRPFVGVSGRKLREVLARCGIDLDRDCITTNSVICRPKFNKTPSNKIINYCRPNLTRTLKEYQPETIILLGGSAVYSLIGKIWREDPGGIGVWNGWKIPSQELNAWVCPTWHPAHVLRENSPVMDMYFEHQLKEACSLQGRPWKSPPDYASRIEKLYAPSEAEEALEGFLRARKPVSFDFETSSIKPDHPDRKILCCSVSDDKRHIAFPWQGKAVDAMKALLTSSVPKLMWNAKFEWRWCKAKLGIRVRNMAFDGMLAAHTLDNRRGIASLKFQAFARLGMPPYEQALKKYMEAKSPGANAENTLSKAPLSSLLLYAGLDSLLEHKICTMQMKELGIAI